MAQQDLIILDKKGYEALSSSLRSILISHLREGKVGLIWLDEATTLKNAELREAVNPTNMQFELSTREGLIPLRTYDKLYQGEALLFNAQPIAHQIKLDFGVFCQPVFNDSYRLMLRAQDKLYRDLWSEILSTTFGDVSETQKIKTDPLARKGEKHQIFVQTDQPENWRMEGFRLAPRQSELNPNHHQFTYWPSTEGWLPLMLGDSIAAYVYHGAADCWQTHKLYHQQFKTKLASQQSIAKSKMVEGIPKPIDPWLIFGVMLVSLTILWLEQRVRS